MIKEITREEYYILTGAYIVACQRQKQVRDEIDKIEAIFGDGVILDGLNDALYNPLFSGNKDELDKLLLGLGVQIQWKQPRKIEEKTENGPKKNST